MQSHTDSNRTDELRVWTRKQALENLYDCTLDELTAALVAAGYRHFRLIEGKKFYIDHTDD